MSPERKVAFAIGAHPDDIEFMMAGTLILLKEAGFELHYMTIANGSCGTTTLPRSRIIRTRAAEARAAAGRIGAIFHRSLVDDIEIFYERKLLARMGAILRDVHPLILLVPSPEDYMEDHTNTSRLAVTAAFCRGMRNFSTIPKRRPVEGDVTVYHALPYGLCDGLCRKIRPGLFVDIAGAMGIKKEMLAMHKSQGAWLDEYQAVNPIAIMEVMSSEVGRMSKRFTHAEGWRRHHHLGFSAADDDPLSKALGARAMAEDDGG